MAFIGFAMISKDHDSNVPKFTDCTELLRIGKKVKTAVKKYFIYKVAGMQNEDKFNVKFKVRKVKTYLNMYSKLAICTQERGMWKVL